MKNLKVTFDKKDITFETKGLIFDETFIERDGRLFFIAKSFLPGTFEISSASQYYGFEFIKENDVFICNPCIICSLDYTDSKISIVKNMEDILTKRDFYIIYKSLICLFIYNMNDIQFETGSILQYILEVLENIAISDMDRDRDCYYFSDGNNNKFSFDIMDVFNITGCLSEGNSYGAIKLTDLSLTIIYSDTQYLTGDQQFMIAIKLPDIMFPGIIDIAEEDDIEYLYALLLEQLNEVEISKYIKGSIAQYLNNEL